MESQNVQSNEEMYITWYLQELKDAGYIAHFKYQPRPFILSVAIKAGTGVSEGMSRLHKGIEYTADFLIEWTVEAYGLFCRSSQEEPFNSQYPFEVKFFVTDKGDKRALSYIDVKGTFSGPNNTSAVTFPIKQAWTYQKHDIYVQKIIPVFVHETLKRKVVKEEGLFPETFTPGRYFFTDGKTQKRKLRYKPVTLQEFLKIHT